MPKITCEGRCPLCHSTHLRLIERVAGEKIIGAYRKAFDIEAGITADEVQYIRCEDCDLNFFSPPSDGPASMYVRLQEFDWYYISDKPEYTLAEKYLPPSGTVLEVGSGKAAFAGIVEKERYVGLEFNDAAIARARASGIKLLKESIEMHAASTAGQYSAVVSFQVLEHVRDPERFIAGCVDALSMGGHLILAVPDHDGLCGMAQNNILDLPPHHVSHWNERAMKRIATQFGVELIAIEREPIANYHLTWARKSIWEQRLRKLFNLKPSLLDTSVFGRAVGRISGMLAKVFKPSTANVSGHTILACYRKV
jgi:SAM-dependent methyltransferase